MYIGIKHLHSYWAYLVLLLILVAVVSALIGWFGKKEFSAANRKIALFALIATHIQVLGGLVLYFVSPITQAAMSNIGGTMKDSVTRLYFLEHPLMMLLGVVLVTVGFSRMKRARAGVAQHKQIAIFYLLGIVLILSRIPYFAWL